MKRILSYVFAICILTSISCVFAQNTDSCVAIGADLTQDQISTIYNYFGISRGSVTEVTVTNADEHQYLDSNVNESIIGTKSISSVYVKTDNANGLNIKTYNITWCTSEMYMNALSTAGITNADVVVSAPFEVSGTAALTGIYKAYEQITGETLDQEAKEAGTEELAVTSNLAETVGTEDSTAIVNDLKSILDKTKDMSDDELRQAIIDIAADYNQSLTENDISQLIKLTRSLEKMDTSELLERVNSVKNMIQKMANAENTANGIVEKVKNIFSSVSDFFKGLFQ